MLRNVSIARDFANIYRRYFRFPVATLLPDAETAEDQIKNVIRRGRARNLVQRAQGSI